jgi:hypothetical protein
MTTLIFGGAGFVGIGDQREVAPHPRGERGQPFGLRH